MKPQDRTRAILRSHLEPSMRLVLIAFADHMDAADSCFVSPETVRDETGLALSTVTLQIAAAQKAGILVRVAGPHKSKDARIVWEAVAAFRPAPTKRGGVRVKGSSNRTSVAEQPNIGSQTETDNRLNPNRTSVAEQPNIGSGTTEHRTLSDQEAITEATSEAPMPPAAPEQSPQWSLGRAGLPLPPAAPMPARPDPHAELYAVWRELHPGSRRAASADTRKAVGRILVECDGLETAGVYLAWVAGSADEAAGRLRGVTPWPDGTIVRRDDLESLSRHIPSRLPLALAWDARGRTDLRPTTRGPAVRTPAPTNKMAAAAAERLAILQEFHDRPGAEPTFTTARIEAT
jgi:hypothetical protein